MSERQHAPPKGRRWKCRHGAGILSGKGSPPPERRARLTVIRGSGSLALLHIKRGFRDGDVSGAFFFAASPGSGLNYRYAYLLALRRFPRRISDPFDSLL